MLRALLTLPASFNPPALIVETSIHAEVTSASVERVRACQLEPRNKKPEDHYPGPCLIERADRSGLDALPRARL